MNFVKKFNFKSYFITFSIALLLSLIATFFYSTNIPGKTKVTIILKENYSPEIMDHTEFANRFPNFWIKLEPGDFYFNGCNRTGKKELFASGDMVRFIFRKEKDAKFRIISN